MSSYLLPYDQYTLCNALLWGNCYNHYNNICNDEESYCKSIFHITVAMIECIPLVGQIVSLAEFFIGILYYDYFSEPESPAYGAQRNYTITHPHSLEPHVIDIPPPLPSHAQMSDRGLVYFNCPINPNPHSRVTNVLWIHIFTLYLKHTDLTHMRCASHSFNSLIVRTPAVAIKLLLSQRLILEIAPRFFLRIGTDDRDARLRLQKRRSLIRKLIKDHWFPVTREILSIVKEEFLANNQPQNFCTVQLMHDYRIVSYFDIFTAKIVQTKSIYTESCRLAICPRSTRESLCVQFLFQYAFHNNGTPLTINSRFALGGPGKSWEEIFDQALLISNHRSS